MKVKELISILKDEDPEKEVYLYDQENAQRYEIILVDGEIDSIVDINFN